MNNIAHSCVPSNTLKITSAYHWSFDQSTPNTKILNFHLVRQAVESSKFIEEFHNKKSSKNEITTKF